LPFEPPDPAILHGDVFLEHAAAHAYLSPDLAFLHHQFGHNWFPPFTQRMRSGRGLSVGERRRIAETCIKQLYPT
jgi:hypothetical protein